jgi:hypothetical protein
MWRLVGSVSIATRYGAGQSGNRISAEAKLFASVQTYPRAHPASCAMDTGSLPPELKRPESSVDHTKTSSAEVKERVEPYLYTPLGQDLL